MHSNIDIKASWLENNPKKTIFLTIILSFIIIFTIAEVFLRFYISFNPSYYVAKRESGKLNKIRYPYGIMIINKYGFPDKEWSDIKLKPRIAYVGDSICYGVGAGYGYRLSELIEKEMPEYEHMNMSLGLGEGISRENIDRIMKWVGDFKIDKVIYIMNLNDILPSDISKQGGKLLLADVKEYFDWIRGKSYLFTYIRYLIKSYYVRLGYDVGGFEAFELHPEKNRNIVVQTTERIAKLAKELKAIGSELIVVIVPYEMQISSAAEKKYKENGIKWSPGFIKRGPQKIIEAQLMKENIKFVDAYYAFLENDQDDISYNNNKLGELFVYNLGDKLDWNHPNRAGHKKIAEYILTRKMDYLKINKLIFGMP